MVSCPLSVDIIAPEAVTNEDEGGDWQGVGKQSKESCWRAAEASGLRRTLWQGSLTVTCKNISWEVWASGSETLTRASVVFQRTIFDQSLKGISSIRCCLPVYPKYLTSSKASGLLSRVSCIILLSTLLLAPTRSCVLCCFVFALTGGKNIFLIIFNNINPLARCSAAKFLTW